MRHDAMGYDTMKSAGGGVPVWMLGLVGVVCLLVGGAVGLLVGGSSEPEAASTPSAASSPAPSVTPSSATPSKSAASVSPQTGTDDSTPTTRSDRDKATARTFMAGWLATDAQKREKLLQRSATTSLAGELMVTAQESIPRTKLTGVERLGGSDLSAEFVATLASGDKVLLSLSPDPEASSGWLVTAVEPWE